MYKNRAIYVILTGLFIIFSFTFLNAQTENKANIKSRPQVLQTKPQPDIQKAQAEQFIKSLPDDRQKTFKAVSSILGKQLMENMKSTKSDQLKEDDTRQILKAAMDKTAIITNATDAEILMQNTMYASMYGIKEELNQIAVQVSTSNHVKAILREEIALLKDLLSDWPDDGSVQEITYRECVKLSDGSYEIIETTRVMSKRQVEKLIENMETQLNTIADMNQMDMLALQDAMNKQAQLMQMMSNIMKQMHDTANAIIRNLK